MIFWLDFIRLEFMYIVIFFYLFIKMYCLLFFHLCISLIRLLRVFWGILWEFILIGYIDRKWLYFKGKVILFSK